MCFCVDLYFKDVMRESYIIIGKFSNIFWLAIVIGSGSNCVKI